MTQAIRFAALPLLLLAAAPLAAQAPAPSSIIALPHNPNVPASQRACPARQASGLGADALRPATDPAGPKPGAGAYVLVNYIGYIAATGQTFDQAMQSALPLDGLIPGFTEGLKLMGKGSVWRFCVPAALGYGAEASGPIPANSDLVFQVELLDMRSGEEMAAAQAGQAAAAAADAAAAAADAAKAAPATKK